MTAHRQHGLGLIEILVSLALGLFIVAVATGLLLSQLREQQRRLIETRLQQELRAGMLLAEHDLRRAGHWADPARGLWSPQGNPLPLDNPYGAVLPDTTASTTNNTTVAYSYSRDTSENQAVDNNERFGLRIHPTTRALELRVSAAALAPTTGDTWQAVSDPQAVLFTELTVTPLATTLLLGGRCSAPCPTGSSDCPPRIAVRQLQVVLAAQSTLQPTVQARMSRRIQLPTDARQGRCPA